VAAQRGHAEPEGDRDNEQEGQDRRQTVRDAREIKHAVLQGHVIEQAPQPLAGVVDPDHRVADRRHGHRRRRDRRERERHRRPAPPGQPEADGEERQDRDQEARPRRAAAHRQPVARVADEECDPRSRGARAPRRDGDGRDI